MDNMEYANKILETYERFLIDQVGVFERIVNRIISEKSRSINNDFMLKISYALTMAMKFFSVAFLDVDNGFISFDTYKYYKEQHNVASVESTAEIKAYRELIVTYKNISLLIKDVRNYIKNNNPSIFLQSFLTYSNENNKLWSLLKTCYNVGINVDFSTRCISNTERAKNSPLSISLNNIIDEFQSNKKVK